MMGINVSTQEGSVAAELEAIGGRRLNLGNLLLDIRGSTR